MADEKAKIVNDATGPGSGPAPAQPEVDAQVSKQEQSAPEAPTPDKAEAPAQEAPAQDKAADAPKEQKAASVSVFNFSEIMAEKKATERAAAQQEAKARKRRLLPFLPRRPGRSRRNSPSPRNAEAVHPRQTRKKLLLPDRKRLPARRARRHRNPLPPRNRRKPPRLPSPPRLRPR